MERSAGDPMSDLSEQLPAKARAVLEANWDSFSSDNPELRPLRLLGLLFDFGCELRSQGLLDEFESMADFRLARLEDDVPRRLATDVKDAVLALFEKCPNPDAEKIAAVSNRVDDEIQIVEWVGGRTEDGREETPRIVHQASRRDPETGESVVERSLHEVRHAWCKFIADRSRLDTQIDPESLNEDFEEALAWARRMASLFPGKDSPFKKWKDCLEELSIEGGLELSDGYQLAMKAIGRDPDAVLENRNWAELFITRSTLEQMKCAIEDFYRRLSIAGTQDHLPDETVIDQAERVCWFRTDDNRRWHFQFPGDGIREFGHLVGFVHLQKLLKNPGRPFLASQILAPDRTEASIPRLSQIDGHVLNGGMTQGQTYQEVVDGECLRSINAQVARINRELEESRQNSNYREIDRLHAEKQELLDFKSRSVRPDGSPKDINSGEDRNRRRVLHAIERAIDVLKDTMPELHAHLKKQFDPHRDAGDRRKRLAYLPVEGVDWITYPMR